MHFTDEHIDPYVLHVFFLKSTQKPPHKIETNVDGNKFVLIQIDK